MKISRKWKSAGHRYIRPTSAGLSSGRSANRKTNRFECNHSLSLSFLSVPNTVSHFLPFSISIFALFPLPNLVWLLYIALSLAFLISRPFNWVRSINNEDWKWKSEKIKWSTKFWNQINLENFSQLYSKLEILGVDSDFITRKFMNVSNKILKLLDRELFLVASV